MSIKKKINLIDIKTSKMVDTIFSWNYKTRFKWHWIEFADLREYEPWDDIKHIDWGITAKLNKPFIKKYEEERQLKCIFLLDIGDDMNFWIWDKTKIDTLLEVFTLLAYSSIKNWDQVWALIFDDRVKKFFFPKKWKAAVNNILSFVLSFIEKKRELKNMSFFENIKINWMKNVLKFNSKKAWENSKKRDVSAALDYIKKYKIKNCLVFALTDQVEDVNKLLLRAAAYQNDLLFVNIFDEFENNLSATWVYNFVQGEANLEVDLSNKKMRNNYIDYRKQKIDNLKVHLRSLRIDHLQVDGKTNIFKCFYNYFKRKWEYSR